MRYFILLTIFIYNNSWSQDYYLLPGKQAFFKEGIKYVKITDSLHGDVRHYTFDKEGKAISYYKYYKGELFDSIIHSYDKDKIVRTTFYDDQGAVGSIIITNMTRII